MFQHLIVPIDGSPASWAVVPIATRMAAEVDGTVEVVTVVDRLADVVPAERSLADGIAALGPTDLVPTALVLANDDVAAALARHVETRSGGMIVMSSHGYGRTAAVLGGTTDALLRELFGPVVVIGPSVRDGAGIMKGPYVIPVDGSRFGEEVVPMAGAWGIEFGGVPWIVEVLPPGGLAASADVFESAYPARLAGDLHTAIGREVEYEVLHGDRAARAVVDFAEHIGAALIFASTHGRTGLARLRLGSVAAEIVRHAPCPVVLNRPPDLVG